ncbi:hypothetical protein P4530_13230 [Bacillus thuringiensis]|nr:hypothetical protein [Bacillus thuringiensis]
MEYFITIDTLAVLSAFSFGFFHVHYSHINSKLHTGNTSEYFAAFPQHFSH